MQPKICVLMATYNGAEYVIEQIESILTQKNVNLTLYISDDFSTDGTYELISNIYSKQKNLILLDRIKRHGSAGKNFYSLFERVDFEDFQYISLADQDDLWNQDKLIASVNAIETNSKFDAVSSNVEAFWNTGKKSIIKKSADQKKYDFIFESAGPGCTYLITRKLALAIKQILDIFPEIYRTVYAHDWFIYAYARHKGYGWKIMDDTTMRYRQHASNETGANEGLKAKIIRLNKLRNGWYLDQVYSIGEIVGYKNILNKILKNRSIPTAYCFSNLMQMRRSWREAIALYFFLLFKIAR